MIFDKRAKASDRLESSEEIALRERKKLEKLETERLQRMKQHADGKALPHVSADDLEGNTAADNSSRYVLEYDKDGKIVAPDEENGSGSDEEDEEDESGSGSGSDEESEEDESDESEEDGSGGDLLGNERSAGNQAKQKTDGLSDFRTFAAGNSGELPFVLSMPNDFEEFQELLRNRSIDEQRILFDRLLKCYHPSLAEGNKARLGKLFVFALRSFEKSAISLQFRRADTVDIEK